MAFYEFARHVEHKAEALLVEYKPEQRLKTNVEFYAALLLHALELPKALFTPTFSIGRVVGWAAHCLEQHRFNRVIRPLSVYIGEADRRWIPIEER